MKNKLTTLGLSVTAILLSSNVIAESKPSPYPDCGIGAALFENNTGATISNVIWDLGTTALTSATASPETCEGFNPDAAAFIEKYKTAFGEAPNFDAAFVYDSFLLLADRIIQVGDNPDAVRLSLLENRMYKGITGDIQILKTGDSSIEMKMGVFKDGEFISLSE